MLLQHRTSTVVELRLDSVVEHKPAELLALEHCRLVPADCHSRIAEPAVVELVSLVLPGVPEVCVAGRPVLLVV